MVFLNLLVKPFSIFGIDATVQNRVGAEEYGLYFTLLNVSFLFNILMDLGINNFTVKNIAQYPHIVSRYMGKLISFRLFLFLIYSTITLLLGAIIGYDSREFSLLYFLIINQFLVTLIAYFRSHFSGFLFFKTEAFISVLDRLLLIFLCGTILLSTSEFKIEWFIWIQTLCYGLTTIIAFLLLLKQIGMPKFSWHWTFSKAIVKKSLPFALLILLMMIYTRSDSIILERIHPNGKHEAGIYAQGFRLLDAFFLFGMIFSNLLFPLFSKLFRNQKSILPLLRTGGNMLIGGSLLIVFFCYFNGEFIIKLIYDTNIKESLPSFQWLMLSFLGMCFSLVFGTLLTAHGSLRILIFYSALSILLNLSMNFFLIPSLGAEGAAISAFSTQTFIGVVQFIYCSRMFNFEFSVKRIYSYLLYVLSIVLIFYLFQSVNVNYYYLFIELLLGTIALFVFKMIHLKELREQFKMED
jgi:O-antigen/teichoic acid export membrane protein